jgi:hypothetical protein
MGCPILYSLQTTPRSGQFLLLQQPPLFGFIDSGGLAEELYTWKTMKNSFSQQGGITYDFL